MFLLLMVYCDRDGVRHTEWELCATLQAAVGERKQRQTASEQSSYKLENAIIFQVNVLA